MYMCVSVCDHVCVIAGIRRKPDEGIRTPLAGVICNFDLPTMDLGAECGSCAKVVHILCSEKTL